MERIINKVDPKFWKNKKVFLTGHTGFKGSWLSIWLKLMEAEVCGFALLPITKPSLFNETKIGSMIKKNIIGDIRDYFFLSNSIINFSPDIVIHMAAQPLVRKSYNEVRTTYETNVMGTVNILEAALNCKSVKAFINITTDKCYENKEWIWGYREQDQLGGKDPYSNSKACSELITQSFKESFFNKKKIGLASARSGNVIGGGDWSEDRLIPDIFKAFKDEKVLKLRNPNSTRPWQHVLEPLSGYLMLIEKLYDNYHIFSGAWNFGPNDQKEKTVEEIVKFISANWENSKWEIDNSLYNPYEANLLKLDISKAINLLNWRPKWTLDETLHRTINWQKSWMNNLNMHEVCINEINDYTNN